MFPRLSLGDHEALARTLVNSFAIDLGFAPSGPSIDRTGPVQENPPAPILTPSDPSKANTEQDTESKFARGSHRTAKQTDTSNAVPDARADLPSFPELSPILAGRNAESLPPPCHLSPAAEEAEPLTSTLAPSGQSTCFAPSTAKPAASGADPAILADEEESSTILGRVFWEAPYSEALIRHFVQVLEGKKGDKNKLFEPMHVCRDIMEASK